MNETFKDVNKLKKNFEIFRKLSTPIGRNRFILGCPVYYLRIFKHHLAFCFKYNSVKKVYNTTRNAFPAIFSHLVDVFELFFVVL